MRLAAAFLILGVRFNSTACFVLAAVVLILGSLLEAVD